MKSFLFTFLLLASCVRAAIVASDGTSTDVAAKLNAASAGDTVTIPAGTYSWTASMSATVAANVTLQGPGTSALGGGDVTTIIDAYDAAGGLIGITIPATGTFRMTGFTVRMHASTTKENGTIGISGPGNLRVDHCHLDNHTNPTNSKPMWIGNGVMGVADNCIMDYSQAGSIYVANGAGTSQVGNETWAEATNFGGSNFFFFEDNLMRATTVSPVRAMDIFSGGRAVLRFNTMEGAAGWEVHATRTGDGRGARAAEGYGNSFIKLTGQAYLPRTSADISSGTQLMWGNSVADAALQNIFTFAVTRRYNAAYANSPTPGNWGYAGPSPIATGVVNITGTAMTWVSGATFNTNWPAESVIYVANATTTKSVASITRSGTTATATCTAHGWTGNPVVYIYGVTGTEDDVNRYTNNGIAVTATVTGVDTFTYTMPGTPSGSATGTIFALVGLQTFSYIIPQNTAGIASVNSTTSITLQQGGYTAGTLTGVTYAVGSAWDGNDPAYHNGYPCLDQPGRGQGDLLTGSFPSKVNSTTGTVAWPNQALEPIYFWMNAGLTTGVADLGNGGNYTDFSLGRVVANRDYYPQASGIQTTPGDISGTPAGAPFDGLTGTGWGTLANRPPRCEPGVAYFAIDQGSWNKSTSNPLGVQMNGASGKLYKCIAPNVWSDYYEPYLYPHPLRGIQTAARRIKPAGAQLLKH